MTGSYVFRRCDRLMSVARIECKVAQKAARALDLEDMVFSIGEARAALDKALLAIEHSLEGDSDDGA